MSTLLSAMSRVIAADERLRVGRVLGRGQVREVKVSKVPRRSQVLPRLSFFRQLPVLTLARRCNVPLFAPFDYSPFSLTIDSSKHV